MQRTKLINPTFEETQELRVAVKHASFHFLILREKLFDKCNQNTIEGKYKALYGLYKSNKMSRALCLTRSFFEDAGLSVPDELYGINHGRRRFYIVELLILLGEYVEQEG